MADTTYSKLEAGGATFSDMMKEFGVVTVMNAKVYNIDSSIAFTQTADAIRDAYKATKPLAYIDSLKVANVTVEGPSKTVTGGQYSNPLIKFGKSARLEMQDALGRADAIEAFGGCVNEYSDSNLTTIKAMHVTEDFTSAKLIIGESFFIDRKKGKQVKVDIIFYQVLPDSIFNLTQDAEGDATVFDMNADLLTTEIHVPVKVSADGGTATYQNQPHGVFYSIIEYKEGTATS
jgi:hypothetical protein